MSSNKNPIIIAHRGAQSEFPEHTLEGYKKAIELGADFIETDLVVTSDGVLVSRHEPYISATTDVADHPEFKDRKTTKSVDGVAITDWFVSDFTLAEIKTLRARQSRSDRKHNYDGQFEIPTIQEVITLAKSSKTTSENTIGIYPELKHPSFHNEIGLPMVDTFLEQIEKNGLNAITAPIFVQCFEVATLQEIRSRSSVRLVQLIGASGIQTDGRLTFYNPDGSPNPNGAPYDFILSGKGSDYGYFATERGMQFVAQYADAIAPWKGFLIPYTLDGFGNTEVLPATDFVSLAHKNSLEVHPYTFRDEDEQWRVDGTPESEYPLFFNTGIDGLFSDYTATAVHAKEVFLKKKNP